MKISCIQMDMEFAKPEENFALSGKLVAEAAQDKPDVILLPETFNTGFFPSENLSSLCDKNGEKTCRIFGGLARRFGVNIIAGSVSDLRGGKIYNTAYVFNRDGECIASYDKLHLFSPMGEDKSYEKGSHLCRFELDGVSCGIVICYDLRFPELTRILALQGIRVLFAVSQWPAARLSHLHTLSAARAIENQFFLALCNSCGRAGTTVYGGGSRIIDPLGNILTQAGAQAQIISAVCDTGIIDGIRSDISVYNDLRPEIYKL